jgi:iron(III) transport system substrate-binding protein
VGQVRFNRKFLAVASTFAIVLAAACGANTPAASSAPSAAPSATLSAFQQEWNTLVAAAKAEGQLNVVGGPEGSQLDGAWYDAFGKQYGIKVNFGGGNAAEVKTRVLAERAQGVYTLDVSGQGGTGTDGFVTSKILQPLAPLIINPEANDRTKGFYYDKAIWSDADRQFCQYVALEANVNIGEFYYNTQKVSQAELDSLKSWKDLLDPKWKGRIVIGDIATGEAATDRTRLWMAVGQSWFDTLIRTQAPKIVAYGDERTYADGVARGDYQVAIFPPGAASLQKAMDSKLPVGRLERTLAEGAPHTGAQRMCIMDHPAHPNAAKLFANWMLMKDGQAALNQFTARPDRLALRSDVPQGIIKDAPFQRVQHKPLIFDDAAAPEFIKARADSQAFLKTLFAELKIVPGK